MKLPAFILASGSPRRRELLAQAGLRFRVEAAQVEELNGAHMTPRELCRANAFRKAQAVARQFPGALVLGADTEVHLGNRVFGKPATLKAAHQMLRRLSGCTHEVTTACCLLRARPAHRVMFDVTTHVQFRPLSDGQIRDYLATINPLDKAGAYAVQENGEWIVEAIEGSFTNIVGLPVQQVLAALASWPAAR